MLQFFGFLFVRRIFSKKTISSFHVTNDRQTASHCERQFVGPIVAGNVGTETSEESIGSS